MSQPINIGYPIIAHFWQDINYSDDYRVRDVTNSRVEIQINGYTVFTKFFPEHDDYYSDPNEEYVIEEAFADFTKKLKALLEGPPA